MKPCRTRASRTCPGTPPALSHPGSDSQRFDPETRPLQETSSSVSLAGTDAWDQARQED
ncbi:hypothetical protein CBM2637_A70315 [Cupriavidus taiwanensis]|nr:hypothetical protein CBM2637_A70315 [Cupriavidus taiwanensis]SPA48498.1 protein of unknown function [Cupriavidus taiwanensis]